MLRKTESWNYASSTTPYAETVASGSRSGVRRMGIRREPTGGTTIENLITRVAAEVPGREKAESIEWSVACEEEWRWSATAIWRYPDGSHSELKGAHTISNEPCKTMDSAQRSLLSYLLCFEG